MTEEKATESTPTPTPKIETEYAAVVDSHLHILENGIEGKDYLITAIGTGKKCIHKYQLVAEVPNIETMLTDGSTLEDLSTWFELARDAKLQDVINMAVKNMFTRPAYDALVERAGSPTITIDPANTDNPFSDYPLVDTGHAQMQVLLDAYRVGAKRATGVTVKADAQAMKAARSKINELGFANMDDALAALALLKQAD